MTGHHCSSRRSTRVILLRLSVIEMGGLTAGNGCVNDILDLSLQWALFQCATFAYQRHVMQIQGCLDALNCSGKVAHCRRLASRAVQNPAGRRLNQAQTAEFDGHVYGQ